MNLIQVGILLGFTVFVSQQQDYPFVPVGEGTKFLAPWRYDAHYPSVERLYSYILAREMAQRTMLPMLTSPFSSNWVIFPPK